MFKMKKIISLLLAVLMVMSTFTVMSAAVGAVTFEDTKLYFDLSSTGWELGAKDKVGFYVFGKDGELLPWGGKKLNGTDEGDEYYSHWRLDHQPVGMVNRLRVSDYTEWTATVHEQVQLTAPLSIDVSAEIDNATHRLTAQVTMRGTDGQVRGNLQLWLVEDGVQAFQYMPDNTVNRDYIHNHVLRCAINGTWGETLALSEGEQKTVTHQLALDEAWNAGRLRVVAFVYNDSGVLQAAQDEADLTETE